jgi:hypothetical protein
MSEIREALKQLLAEELKHTPASTTPTGYQLHGPLQMGAYYGPLTYPGVRPEMYSAMTHPLTAALVLDGAMERSEFTDQLLEIQTGVTAADTSGTAPTTYCGNPFTTGQGKFCTQKYIFGEYFIKDALQVIPKIGQLRNRADVPKQILNTPPQLNPLLPEAMYGFPDDSQSQLRYGFYLVGVSMERDLEYMLVQGSSAGGAYSHFMSQFNGLDQLIKTGYADAVTNRLCPALDSAVIDFSADVTGTTTGGGGTGRSISQALNGLLYSLNLTAMKGGFSGVQHMILMRPELFYEVAQQIACNYSLNRCNTSPTINSSFPMNQDATKTNDMLYAMMNGQFLWANGRQYPVILSEGVAQQALAADTFASNAYVVPVSWAGSRLLRLEYFPMDNPYISEYSGFLNPNTEVMNGGLWLAAARDNGFCKEHLFAARMRLILETPWLAGRIDDVQYTYSAPEGTHNALPDGSYHYDGGMTKYFTPVV